MPNIKESQKVLIVGVALAFVTLLCYWPITNHRFVNVDDDLYIYDNPHVQAGLTWPGLAWAFTTGHAGNWHPLTWLSHMADCRIFGLKPGGHHLMSLLFHIANSVLIFLLLRQMTDAIWRCAFVAALFALHPLHVESVAWASERKDMISAFFWLLATMAYIRYAGELIPTPSTTGALHSQSKVPSSQLRPPYSAAFYYILALACFALGLLSKPMVVTLPCVLLLMDFWPLRRLETSSASRLLMEKIPFFVLTCAASVVTFLVQKGAQSSLQELSLISRLSNSVLAYAGYISKTFWPVNLAAIYPLPRHLIPSWVILAGLALGGLTLWLVRRYRRQPYLLIGWLWFLGTLVPTIGLVQVGAQAMADRYMYIPSIGLFMFIVWGVAVVLDRRLALRNVSAAIGTFALIACWFTTRAQLGYWKDSTSLFRHAIEVTNDNEIAYDHLGKAMLDNGKLEEAANNFAIAAKLVPGDAEAHYKVASVRLFQSRLDDAIHEFTEALRLNPHYAEAHRNIAVALMRKGRHHEGATHFAEALRISPTDPDAHFNLGVARLELQEPVEAGKCFIEALRLRPDSAKTQYHLAVALAAQPERSREAIVAGEKAQALALASGESELAAKASAFLEKQKGTSPQAPRVGTSP